MPRRNASDASGRHPKVNRRRKAKSRRPPTSLRVVTQQENILRFFVIGPDATKGCESLPVRPPRTVATIAVQP